MAKNEVASLHQSKRVLIFRNDLLPLSETFVLGQARSLVSYEYSFAGVKHVSGLDLSSEATITLGDRPVIGKFQAALFKQFGLAPGFHKAIADFNPSIVHAHFGPSGAVALPLARALNVPLVTTFHGYDVTKNDDALLKMSRTARLYIRRRTRLAEQGALFIAVSEYIKDLLIRRGFPASKIVVHHIGVDTQEFRPRGGESAKPIVLFVGRLVENKGLHLLIKAMALVQERVPEAQLVVIGDGPLRNSLEELAINTLANFRFMGAQTNKQVLEWMGKAQLLSVPSIEVPSGDSEAFGMVFAEAQAVGLPVVSFATGGIPEAVASCETGILVEPGDWIELSRAISRLMMDADLRERYSNAARMRTVRLFDLKSQTRKLETIYDRVVSGCR